MDVADPRQRAGPLRAESQVELPLATHNHHLNVFHVVQLIGQRFHAQHQIAQTLGLALLGRIGVGDVDRAAGRGDFHPHLSRKARRQPGQNETEKQSHAQGLSHVFPLL